MGGSAMIKAFEFIRVKEDQMSIPSMQNASSHLVDPQHAPDKRGRSYRTLVKIDKFQTVDERT
jgi:hypothetical protein